MNKDELADVFAVIAKSLRSSPDQFSIAVEVSITGTSIRQEGPGTGLSVSAVGGGPGSVTTGMMSSASGGAAEINVAQRAANKETARQISVAASALETMTKELRTPKPDSSKLVTGLSEFAQKVIPAAIVEVVKFGLQQLGVKS